MAMVYMNFCIGLLLSAVPKECQWLCKEESTKTSIRRINRVGCANIHHGASAVYWTIPYKGAVVALCGFVMFQHRSLQKTWKILRFKSSPLT
jgi:hypothetical protein